METGLTKNRIVAELTRSAHGELKQYAPIAKQAAMQEPEFTAHLIAWNERNGHIRDSKVALPICSLSIPSFDGELAENSLAHLALLDPRNLLRAVRFGREVKTPLHGRAVLRLVERYLRAREDRPNWWNATAVQHRGSMKELYALCHVKPSEHANKILFKGWKPAGSAFEVIARLKDMATQEAATAIMKHRLPFLIVSGALGKKAKDPDLLLAMVEQMTPNEVITNAKMLERFGVKDTPAARGALEAKLQEAAQAKKGTQALKTTRAAEALGDSKLAERLRGVQEKQLDKLAVEGNWLVLGDKSGSMSVAIETARHIAATLARLGKGNVYLVFFDTAPRAIDATGKDYDVLLKETARISGNGGTCFGCGMQYAYEKDLEIDGIAIVSDGGENTAPLFADVYQKYCKKFDKEPPVYFYIVPGSDRNVFSGHMASAGLDLQEFDLRESKIDYYSLPNLVSTMRTKRYGLVEQIMEMPLLTLNDAFKVRDERGLSA